MSDTDICNFADDTAAYVCDVDLESVLEKSEENSELVVTWFEKDYMKLNTDERYLIVCGKKYEHVWVKLGKDKIWESNNVKLLGAKIDNELKFDEHISNICLKANRKLSALARLSRTLSLKNEVLYSKPS